jgi:hypothetical protein
MLVVRPAAARKQTARRRQIRLRRNYDDAGGEFGDTSIAAGSADQGKLAVYAALRSKDDTVTIVVVNKTFVDLKSDVALAHLKTAKHAEVYQYSSADLIKIRELPDAAVTRVSKKEKTSALKHQVFPAMSITLFVARAK